MSEPAPYRLRRRYTRAWLAWLAAFATLETAAVLDAREGDTLSEHVWSWASVLHKGKFWLARRVVFAGVLWGGAAWVCVHLVTGLSALTEEVPMPAFLVPLIAFAKPWLVKIGVGLVMPWLIGVVKSETPRLWEKIPEAVRPYVSTILGALATGGGSVATSAAGVVLDAAAGAAGGAAGKVVRDRTKNPSQKVREALGQA